MFGMVYAIALCNTTLQALWQLDIHSDTMQSCIVQGKRQKFHHPLNTHAQICLFLRTMLFRAQISKCHGIMEYGMGRGGGVEYAIKAQARIRG